MGTDHVLRTGLERAGARDLRSRGAAAGRASIVAVAVSCAVACRSAPPPSPLTGFRVIVSTVEWRVAPSDPDHVEIELVVDGMTNKLGSVAATPELCAIRSASAKTTELLCGEVTFDANVEPGELVVLRDAKETTRIPIGPSVAISVAPYRMPEPATGR